MRLTSRRWLTACARWPPRKEWVLMWNVIHSRAPFLRQVFVSAWLHIWLKVHYSKSFGYFFSHECNFTNQKGLLEVLNLPFELDYKSLLYCVIILAIPISLTEQALPSQKKTHPQGLILFLFHIFAIPAHWPNCNLFSIRSFLNIHSIVFWCCSQWKSSICFQMSKYFCRKRECNM